jgi:hypothetical protein
MKKLNKSVRYRTIPIHKGPVPYIWQRIISSSHALKKTGVNIEQRTDGELLYNRDKYQKLKSWHNQQVSLRH